MNLVEWEQVIEENPGEVPLYLPGDIIKSKGGRFGIIVKAQVLIKGIGMQWWERPPRKDETSHGNTTLPQYACDPLPGGDGIEKYAWWESNEWVGVIRGPLHIALKRSLYSSVRGEYWRRKAYILGPTITL